MSLIYEYRHCYDLPGIYLGLNTAAAAFDESTSAPKAAAEDDVMSSVMSSQYVVFS